MTKINQTTLKATPVQAIKAAIAALNANGGFPGPKVKTGNDTKTEIAQRLVNRVQWLADKGLASSIPVEVQELVGKLEVVNDQPVTVVHADSPEEGHALPPAPKAPKAPKANPTPKPMPKVKAQPVKAKGKAQVAPAADGAPTSKMLAYQAFAQSPNDATRDLLYKATNEAVKLGTCGTWLSEWKRNTNLPRGAQPVKLISKKVKAPKAQEV
jgi:hypothetical protein